MRIVKRLLVSLIILLSAGCVGLLATGNVHVLYGLRKTYLVGKKNPDIDDMGYFDVRKVSASAPKATLKSRAYNVRGLTPADGAWVDSMQTTALLIYRGDSLMFEHYSESDSSTLSNSFSMAKSITSLLIGKALEEGLIHNVDDQVGTYLDAYRTGMDTLLTVRHLLEMTSGIPFGESYSSPLGYMAKSYYGKDLKKATLDYHVQVEPGTLWAYEGGNTVLLGMILEKVTGTCVSDYCAQKLWGPIGAEHDAYWNLDHAAGIEKTFSGFYATARDFARLGLLFLHDGEANGDAVISSSWVGESLMPHLVADEKAESCTWYGKQWWLGEYKGQSFFACRGLRGQYVVGIPDLDIVVVRLGHTQSKERIQHMPADLFRYLDISMHLVNGHS